MIPAKNIEAAKDPTFSSFQIAFIILIGKKCANLSLESYESNKTRYVRLLTAYVHIRTEKQVDPNERKCVP